MTNPIRPRALSFAQVAAVLLLLTAVLLGTASSATAQRRPRDVRVRAVLRAARNALGTRYSYGGTSPASGFDCSGLTRWAWSKGGDWLPHNAWQHTEEEVTGWLHSLGVTEFTFHPANPNGLSVLLRKPA